VNHYKNKNRQYQIQAKLILDVTRYIEADTEDEAMEIALNMGGDEWMDYVVGELIEDVDASLVK
jgi:hypothetical protein